MSKYVKNVTSLLIILMITANVQASPSVENMAIYALTYHFVGGKTLYYNIYYNKPAEVISFENGKISFSTYCQILKRATENLTHLKISPKSGMLERRAGRNRCQLRWTPIPPFAALRRWCPRACRPG